MTDKVAEQKHTPDTVMKKLVACETEVGQQMEALRTELDEHKAIVTAMRKDWDDFLVDFKEMFGIFKTAKGGFRFMGWIGVGLKWIAISGAALTALIIFLKTGHWPGIGK